MAFKTGDRVRQSNYGAGTITASDSNYTVIDFDAHGTRRFVTRLMGLEETTEQAPQRAAAPKRARKTAPKAAK